MKARGTKTGVTLQLTDEEALLLTAVVGHLSGSRGLPWYDRLADALEQKTERYGEENAEWPRYTSIRVLTAPYEEQAKAIIAELHDYHRRYVLGAAS